MSVVTNEDLSQLLNILYQGAVRKSPLALPSAVPSSTLFFLESDIPNLATEYGFPLPSAGVTETLKAGLSRGVFVRSIQDGTQCGSPACHPNKSALPTLIYGYNPQMARVNQANKQLLNSLCLNNFIVHGSHVVYSNNRAPNYGNTRGWYTTDNPLIKNKTASIRKPCCG